MACWCGDPLRRRGCSARSRLSCNDRCTLHPPAVLFLTVFVPVPLLLDDFVLSVLTLGSCLPRSAWPGTDDGLCRSAVAGPCPVFRRWRVCDGIAFNKLAISAWLAMPLSFAVAGPWAHWWHARVSLCGAWCLLRVADDCLCRVGPHPGRTLDYAGANGGLFLPR